MPNSYGGQALINHFQQEKKEDRDLKMITKRSQVQSAMEELLTEVKCRDWEDAEVQEAMHKVRDWESRRLVEDFNSEFLEAIGWIKE